MAQANIGDTVRIHYSGKLKDGTIFDSSDGRDPLEFKIGDNKIIPDLEASIVGMAVGDTADVEIPADKAYGPHQPNAVQSVERSMIPEGIDLTIGRPASGDRTRRPDTGSDRGQGRPTRRSRSTAIIRWPAKICSSISNWSRSSHRPGGGTSAPPTPPVSRR